MDRPPVDDAFDPTSGDNDEDPPLGYLQFGASSKGAIHFATLQESANDSKSSDKKIEG